MSSSSEAQRLRSASPGRRDRRRRYQRRIDIAAYDYTGLDISPGVTTGWVAGDGNLHATGEDTVSEPRPMVQHRTTSAIASSPRSRARCSPTRTEVVTGAGQAGLGDVTVTLVDNTTSSRRRSRRRAAGLSRSTSPSATRTPCAPRRPAGYQQSAPTSGAATCPAGGRRLPHPVPSTGSTTNYFGFRPLGSVAGTVFNDVNQNLANDDSSPLGGWTVTLYGGAQPVSTTSNTDGSYKINAAFSTSTQYTLCETPPSGAPAGTPGPRTCLCRRRTTVCGPNQNGNGASGVPNELLKGLQFTPRSVGATITGKDFGNVAAVTCNPDGTVPSPTWLRRQPSALDLLHDRHEGAHWVCRRLGCPARRHAVRQRLDRRLARRESSAARAHQLPRCARTWTGRSSTRTSCTPTRSPSREPR